MASLYAPGKQNAFLQPGQTYKYMIPSGLQSAQFWPKMGCNSQGQQCSIGDSGGPGQQCAEGGCASLVDSKFEATFGPDGGNCLADRLQCDWWDTSCVDGYTLPDKVEVSA